MISGAGRVDADHQSCGSDVMIPTERDLDVDRAYRLGCIVGAAIVAWGDAMRGMVRRAPVQGDRTNPPGSIDWEEHLAVYDCYAVKYGRDQSAERLAQRGGFGKQEAEMLLGRPLRTWRRA